MPIGPDERKRMERAHVAAWPALRTAELSGWLWRCSGGGSQRANSVSAIDFTGADPAHAIDEAEQLYRSAGAPPRFQTFDETSPPDLPSILAARGYRRTESTTTMFKTPADGTAPPDVEIRDRAWDAWLQVYLTGITENRRTINRQILSRVPPRSAFFAAARNGRLVSTALCVVSHRCAVIECVATAPDARRQGSARRLLNAVEHWATGQAADLLGLQVVSDNTAAIGLYQGLGFVPGAANCFWVRE